MTCNCKCTCQEEFVTPTFETFLTESQIKTIVRNVHVVEILDFNQLRGDTIKEKYEDIYLKILDVTNKLIANGAKGYFWILTTTEVGNIFQSCIAGFVPTDIDKLNGQLPLGMPGIKYTGLISSKWRLYETNDNDLVSYGKIYSAGALQPEKYASMLIGCNDTPQYSSHYGIINMSNFII